MSTIKSLICEERPREKLSQKGTSSLTNAELLGIILNNGNREKSAIGLGEEIIQKANGIKNLMNISLAELMEIDGIGLAKASRVLAALELSKRVSKEKGLNSFKFNSPESIFETYSEEMRYLKKEVFKVLLLDAKNKLIGDIVVSEGSLSSSIVHPREVMIQAIRNSASKLILLHNHPSGDPSPSSEDKTITNRLKESGDILGIPILDHIIIGDGTYYSFRENDLVFS